jgi:ADP-ribose pyrophosphatase YjhB (NUDIX family)
MMFGESLAECAEREVREETKLEVVAENQACFGFDTVVSSDLQYVVLDVRARLRDDAKCDPLAADDAADARFVDRFEFAKLNVNAQTKCLVEVLSIFDYKS